MTNEQVIEILIDRFGDSKYDSMDDLELIKAAKVAVSALLAQVGPGCGNCGYKVFYNGLKGVPDCNTCGVKGNCAYEPEPGALTRINCPLWVKKEASK